MTEDSRMTLLGHLGELRGRVIRSLIALVLCTFVSFGFFYDIAKQLLVGPLEGLNPETTNVFARYNPIVNRLRPYLVKGEGPGVVRLHAMTAMETFTVKFKLALVAGFVLSAPYLIYQMWAFIASGLLERERRTVYRYLPLSVALFLAGMAFAYFIAIPAALLFLLSVDPGITPVLMVGPYFSLVVTTVGVFGIAFQMPLVAMALARIGIVPARAMARYRRYAIVLIFLLAAILTPPEPFTQCLLALPLVALYELGVVLARVAERRN